MNLNLSWHQKFLALIIVTPLGFFIIGAAIFWGLEAVSSSYKFTYDVVSYQNQSSELMTSWNALEKDLGTFQAGDRDALMQRLDQFGIEAASISERAQALNDEDIVAYAEKINADASAYVEQRALWLTQASSLGLSDDTGIRKELTEALSGLQGLGLSLFDDSIAEVVRTENGYFVDRNPAFAEDAEKAVATLEFMVKQYDWEEGVVGDTVRAYRKVFDRAAAQMQEIHATSNAAKAAGQALSGHIEAQDNALESGLIATAISHATSVESSAKWVSIGALALFAPLLVLVLYLTSRTLVSRLHDVVALLSRVSEGDLTQKLALGRNERDEFNQLATATNQMIDNIGLLMRDAIASTNSLMEVREELDRSMTRLASNSETVESQTIQAATASQQISVTLADVAQRTSQVGISTQNANESAQSGAQVVEQSVEAMQRLSNLIQDTHTHVKELNQSSAKVTGIIDVINGLADQTNLLALNAAIEAARAGEAGRGFSVVADEVRTLARKTMEATTNIVGIINDLNKQTASMDSLTEHGLKLARDSEASAGQIASAMTGVTGSIETLNAEMDQVVVAVEEISVTTEDIAQKMEEIRLQSSETQTIGSELGTQNERLTRHANRLLENTSRFTV